MNRAGEKGVVAIFDIDKTLLPGYAIIDFAKYLSLSGQFNLSSWEDMENLIVARKKNEIDYNQFADKIVEAYARGIRGQNVEEVHASSAKFWADRVSTLFPFVQTIMHELTEMDALKIAVSGSTYESLIPLLELLQFSEVHTTQMETEDGRYTGKVLLNAASQQQKDRIVSGIISEISPEAVTYGYGDSIADLAFLSLVANPVVVGTHDEELVQVAKANGWRIETSHEK